MTTENVTSCDGTSIAFETLGSGPAVILVDGAMCSRRLGPMDSLAAELKSQFTVYKYDRRGRNESGDTAPYAIQKEVEDLEAIIARANQPVFLFGMSSGALLSLQAATGNAKLKRVAIYEPPFTHTQAQFDEGAAHTFKLKQLIANKKPGSAVRYFLTKMLKAPLFFVLMMQFMPIWKKLTAIAHTLPYDSEISADPTLPLRLKQIKIPIFVVSGEKSVGFLRDAVDALSKLLPSHKRLQLGGQNHTVSMKLLAPHVISFFNDDELSKL